MNKNRLIFFAVFAVFHLSALIFTVMLDNDTSLLFSMVSYVPWFKFATFLGLLLLVIDVIWSWIINRDSLKEKAALMQELNTLKAKLFDLQEAEKKTQTPQQTK